MDEQDEAAGSRNKSSTVVWVGEAIEAVGAAGVRRASPQLKKADLHHRLELSLCCTSLIVCVAISLSQPLRLNLPLCSRVCFVER